MMNFLAWAEWLLWVPAGAMAASAMAGAAGSVDAFRAWRTFRLLSVTAALAALTALSILGINGLFGDAASTVELSPVPGIRIGVLGLVLAVLVQGLGSVIGVFSSRYLEGEANQARYVAWLSAVLACVQVLLMADHWVVLGAAWALVGVALNRLLCFYPERPFALLAAHKKRMADRLADGLMVVAAGLAWAEVGSGSLSDLQAHLATQPPGTALEFSAVALVLAVVLRTALLPVHGWLIQVMEAPTPVSALLHAGVVNLGGYVLIRMAPLWEAVPLARWTLVILGVATAALAGLVMLTRVSIKVRLAWSTVAQMGFMVMECGLGLYTLAALHLIGHSLYKAHAFLASSTVVRETRLQMMRGFSIPAAWSLWAAPLIALTAVMLVPAALSVPAWPWWWGVVLALAWAPLLWMPSGMPGGVGLAISRLGAGVGMVCGLTCAALLAHVLPWGLTDRPDEALGLLALGAMTLLYLALALMQWRPEALSGWRRWSYAGFYVDEFYTRLALWIWPTAWAPGAALQKSPAAAIVRAPQ